MKYSDSLNFIFRMPTKVVFGKGTAKEVPLEMKELGVSRALVVTDRFLYEKTEIVNDIVKALGEACVGVFADVEPDTGVDIVDSAYALFQEKGADVIVSVGGGSSIDTAKGVQIAAGLGKTLKEIGSGGVNLLNAPTVPHISVPTTAGTGSEVTYAAVIKDREKKQKLIFADNFIIPSVAILDPLVTVGMPKSLTAHTGLDAFTHAVEAVHSNMREPVADALALHAVRLIYEYLPAALKDGNDIVARGQMLIAACIAGAAFSNAQVGVVHALAHSVGAKFGVPHGLANAILLPHCMRFNAKKVADRYAEIGKAMGLDLHGKSDEDACEETVKAIEDFIRSTGIPTRLRDVNVPQERLSEAAETAIYDGSIVNNPRFAMDPKILEEILQNAW